MAVVTTVAFQRFVSLTSTTSKLTKSKSSLSLPSSFSTSRIAAVATNGARKSRPPRIAVSIDDEIDVISVQSVDSTDQQGGIAPLINREREEDGSCLEQTGLSASQIMGFAFENRAGGGGEGGAELSSSSSPSGSPIEVGNQYKIVDRVINASIVLATGLDLI